MLAVLAAVLLLGCRTSGFAYDQIEFSITGGIAGFDQRYVIKSDGTFEQFEKGRVLQTNKLTGEELKGLKERMGKVPWAALQDKYVDPKVADAMFETIVLRTGSKSYKTTIGTGGTPPAELREVLDYLREALRNHKQG